MTVEERIELRNALLGGIYDNHFANIGGGYSIADQANASTENFLAYLYLHDSGFITAEIEYDLDGVEKSINSASITFKGIDRVEGVGFFVK